MKRIWIVRLQPRDAMRLGHLRLHPQLEVCEHDDAIWLRVSDADDALVTQIRSLPGTRFYVLEDRQLVRFGRHVPEGREPSGPWVSIAEWMTVEIGSASLPARPAGRHRLHWVRGGADRDSNVLLTSAARWRNYGVLAPQLRLDCWTFVSDETGRVIVRGSPLPPLAGIRYVEQRGVAAQSGWRWFPELDCEVLRSLLRLGPNDLALLHGTGTWDHIRGDQFVRATRSAIRLSTDESTHG